jgi:hypothetical protein
VVCQREYLRKSGTFDSSPTVSVSTSVCSAIKFVADTSLLCRVAMGMGAALEVIAKVDGQTETGIDMFSYGAPVISHTGIWLKGLSYNVPNIQSIFPGLGPSSGGGTLTILGESFGAVRMFVLQCITPPGSGLRLPVSVSVEGQISTLQAAYSYMPPLLYRIKPARAVNSITLLGTNFGVKNDSQISKIGGSSVHSTHWVSDSTAVIATAEGVGDSAAVQFTVRNQQHSLDAAFSFVPPQLSVFRPPNIPAKAAIFTVLGYSFGSNDYTGRIKVPAADQDQLRVGSACEASLWASDSQISCKAASGGGSLVTLSVTVAM